MRLPSPVARCLIARCLNDSLACISAAAVLAVAWITPPAVLAAGGLSLTERVAQAEQILFGRTSPGLPVETRLDNLEKALCGQPKPGTVIERLGGVERSIGVSQAGSADSVNTDSGNSGSTSPAGEAPASSSRPAVSSEPTASSERTVSPEPDSSVAAAAGGASGAPAPERPAVPVPASVAPVPPSVSSAALPSPGAGQRVERRTGPQAAPGDSETQLQPGAPAETGSSRSSLVNLQVSTSSALGPQSSDSDQAGGSAISRVARIVPPDRSHFPPADQLRAALDDIRAGKLDEADRLLFAVTEREPFNDVAFFNLGMISARRGQIVDALRNYRIAFNMHPENQVYRQAVDDMENRIQKFINKQYHICNYYPARNDLASLLNQGVRFWGIGFPEEARSLFDRVLRLDPNNIDGYYDRAIVEEHEHHYQQALQDYMHAAALLAHPGAERLQGEFTEAYKNLPEGQRPVPPMLSTVITSAEDSSFNLNQEIFEAINDVSKEQREATEGTLGKLGGFVGKVGEGLAGAVLPGAIMPVHGSPISTAHVDTCDRCQIVRDRIMGPD